VDDLWAMKSKNVGLIVRAISFQDSQLMRSLSTYVTDRRTDGQTDDMRSQDRPLHYSASRGKNEAEMREGRAEAERGRPMQKIWP